MPVTTWTEIKKYVLGWQTFRDGNKYSHLWKFAVHEVVIKEIHKLSLILQAMFISTTVDSAVSTHSHSHKLFTYPHTVTYTHIHTLSHTIPHLHKITAESTVVEININMAWRIRLSYPIPVVSCLSFHFLNFDNLVNLLYHNLIALRLLEPPLNTTSYILRLFIRPKKFYKFRSALPSEIS